MTAPSPGELARYGITEPIFAVLRDAYPTGIAWLTQTDEVPDLPGLACLGVGNELRMLRVADSSLRATARQVLESNPWPGTDSHRAWVVWHVVEVTGEK